VPSRAVCIFSCGLQALWKGTTLVVPKQGITISVSPALAAAATLQGLKAQNKVICTSITARINPCPFAPGPRPVGRLYIPACLCYALSKMDEKNKLYFGDNLKILRDYVTNASVDLIYLDPPFNSSATYNVLFKEKSGEESAVRFSSPPRACRGAAQITAFEDT